MGATVIATYRNDRAAAEELSVRLRPKHGVPVHTVPFDLTAPEFARSRPTVKRPNLADWAGYGYCASHSRFFWGLRLHLICTPSGLTVGRLGASQPEDR
jgi:hypothetical protein